MEPDDIKTVFPTEPPGHCDENVIRAGLKRQVEQRLQEVAALLTAPLREGETHLMRAESIGLADEYHADKYWIEIGERVRGTGAGQIVVYADTLEFLHYRAHVRLTAVTPWCGLGYDNRDRVQAGMWVSIGGGESGN